MTTACIIFGLLVLSVQVLDAGVAKHGKQDKVTKDGERNPHFDHEAIIGSAKEEEEFEDLPPEEAKKRLAKMAKLMDLDSNGQVTEEELVDWIMKSFRRLDEEDAREQFREQDVDHDGQVSWKEYKDKRFDYDLSKSSEDEKERMKKEIDDDHTKFKAADANDDHQLNIEEYIPFHLPHHHEHMHENEIDMQLKEHDKDKDGHITFEEFFEDVGDPKYADDRRKEFDGYDSDHNGYLDRKEMKPWAVFDDRFTATDEAQHLIRESDDNKDGQLAIDEIVKHHEEFVGSQATDYGTELHRYKEEL